MLIHEVRPKNKLKRSGARIGRGGKRGTYSGRGQKGQKAHAGRRIKPAVYELISRLPKLRGYKNKPMRSKPLAVNVGELSKIKGSKVNADSLKEAGIIKNSALRRANGRIKILGEGEAAKAFEIDAKIKVSEKAKSKIKAAGGKATAL